VGVGRRPQEAFEDFCAREYPRLVGAVALIIGDADAAADSVNEALARAWNRVRRGHDIESLGAWLRVVALNIGYDQHRKRAVEARHAARLAGRPAPAGGHEAWGVTVDVQRALAALPHRQREVAVLHYIFDLSVATIAEELNVSPGTVKTCLHRARLALHDALRDESEEVWARDAS
jgi:RNA polymerase sigma-70 factor (ECF subfamily)